MMPSPQPKPTKAALREMDPSAAHSAFSTEHDAVAQARSNARCDRRAAARQRRLERAEFFSRNPALAEAYAEQREHEYDAAYRALCPDSTVEPTPRQRRIFGERLNRDEHPEWFVRSHVNDAYERFHSERGYAFNGGVVSDSYSQRAFNERGARSTSDPGLRRFVAAACTRGGVRAGFSKTAWKRRGRKFRGLDMPNIRVCESGALDVFRGLDLDPARPWPTEAAFLADLAAHCERVGVWPRIVTWTRDDDRPGSVRSAHCWFVLREGYAVWRGNSAGALAQRRLLDSVAAALVIAFEPLGADPGGLSDLFQGKCPLSPHNEYRTFDAAGWPTLRELYDALGAAGQTSEKAVRAVSAARAAAGGVDYEQSQEAFDWLRATTNAAIRQIRSCGGNWRDAGAVRAAVWSQRHGCPIRSYRADWRLDREIGRMLDRVVTFAIATFDERKADANVRNRGRIAHRVVGLDKRERQAAGGRYSAEKVGRQSIVAISRAMADYVTTGTTPTRHAIAEATGLSRDTVGRWWAQAWDNAVASHALECARKAAAEHRAAVAQVASRLVAGPGAVKGYILTTTQSCGHSLALADSRNSQIRTTNELIVPSPGRLTMRFLSSSRIIVFGHSKALRSAA